MLVDIGSDKSSIRCTSMRECCYALLVMLVVLVAIRAAFACTCSVRYSAAGDVLMVVLSPKINDLEEAKLIFSVECHASVEF